MTTQHQKILEILRSSGNNGMNSFRWRTMFIQLPVRIKELKEEGYLITTRKRRNRSVDYILLGEPGQPVKPVERIKQPWEEELIRVEHPSGRVTWESPDYFKQKGLNL